jgi:adenylosuccinate lyase
LKWFYKWNSFNIREGDPLFSVVHGSLDTLLDPAKFVGRAPEQTREFLSSDIDPILIKYAAILSKPSVDTVNV